MAQPALQEIRDLTEWKPPLGVISVYLEFDPADRDGAWRTRLRNGLDEAVAAARDAQHERRMAVRATAERLLERFDDDHRRPPPRAEAGFVEIAAKRGAEHWWQLDVAPAFTTCVHFGEEPLLAPLIDAGQRAGASGVALVSAERVRLLQLSGASVEELEEWELSIFSLDWRERKSQSANNPARGQGVSASGHDQYGERLDHNRQRFLAETAQLTAGKLRERGLDQLLVFGPPADRARFCEALSSRPLAVEPGGDADLISVPTGQLGPHILAAAERLGAEREQALVERALGKADGGRPGSLGLRDTTEALGEGRVEHLVFDAALGERAEALVRRALAGGAGVTIVRDGLGDLLAPAEGVAGILRY